MLQLIFDLMTAAFFFRLFARALKMYAKRQDKMFETETDYRMRRYTAVGLMAFYVIAAYISIFVFRFSFLSGSSADQSSSP